MSYLKFNASDNIFYLHIILFKMFEVVPYDAETYENIFIGLLSLPKQNTFQSFPVQLTLFEVERHISYNRGVKTCISV